MQLWAACVMVTAIAIFVREGEIKNPSVSSHAAINKLDTPESTQILVPVAV
jgi:hypothetical protein